MQTPTKSVSESFNPIGTESCSQTEIQQTKIKTWISVIILLIQIRLYLVNYY